MNTYLKYYLACGLILVIGWTGIFEPARYLIHAVLNPVQFGLYTTYGDVKEFASFFTSLKKIRNENLALLAQVALLEAQLANMKGLQDENAILKNELKLRVSGETQTFVEARVVGSNLNSTVSEITLDQGLSLGIAQNAQVTVSGNLVGKVIAVEPHRSTVELLTSPKFAVNVVDIDSPSKAKGIVSGLYGTSIVMDRILQDEVVAKGDTIVTSGDDGEFPRGLLVGKVVNVVSKESEPIKQAQLSSEIDFSNLSIVFVETKQ